MEISLYFIQQSLLVLAVFLFPLFALLLISGIIISVIQAMFQIHESSIVFVTKLAITTAYMFIAGKDFYNHYITLVIKIFEGR